MKRVAIDNAEEHLELAKDAAEKLILENGPKVYAQAWSQFLTQSSRFYSKLEQGAKGCNTSEPWFGQMKHERKEDSLLSYIHHARNSDEHGLDYVVEQRGSRLDVKTTKNAGMVHTEFEMMVDSSGKTHIRNPKTKTPEAVQEMNLIDPRMELVTVTDRRFNKSFEPPTMHQGRPLVDRSPSGVAKLAIVYLENMLKAASELPEHV